MPISDWSSDVCSSDLAEALFDESLQVVAVDDGDFLADDAFVRIALLEVRHAAAGVQRRQVLDEADVERRPGLFVDAAATHESLYVGIHVGVVLHNAGSVQPEGGAGGRVVETDNTRSS